jgi:hypothetical protein
MLRLSSDSFMGLLRLRILTRRGLGGVVRSREETRE